MSSSSQQVGIEEPSSPSFSHNVKVESTAKGLRIHVHVYGMDETDVALSALRTYEAAIEKFKTSGYIIAPFSVNGSGDK